MQTETHTSEPLAPEPSTFKVEVNTEKFERYKLQGIYIYIYM
jgi:hypothetical protein